MKISVDHTTVYRYRRAVSLAPHTFRLRPRMTNTQQLIAFDIQIQPQPVGTTECLDQDGNLSLYTWFGIPTDELNVRSQFTVEMARGNPFDFVLSEDALKLPLWYTELLSAALAPYRDDTKVSDAVKRFAKSVASDTGWQTLSFLDALNQRIFQSSHHVTRPEGPPYSSQLTLSLQEGSCRDLTILFCDACRAMGLAARFVSGYECAAAGQQGSYMHAWAEVYLPSAGWRGYDPSRGLAVSNGHVAVAAGFDHNLAAPVSGVYTGDAESVMEASIDLQIQPDATR